MKGNITHASVKAMREDINEALKEVGKKYGIELHAGNASFTRDGMTGKFQLKLVSLGSDGKVFNPAEGDFKSLCKLYGFEASALGRTFTSRGERYAITGLNAKARKNIIIAERAKDGAEFVFPLGVVLECLGKTSGAKPHE